MAWHLIPRRPPILLGPRTLQRHISLRELLTPAKPLAKVIEVNASDKPPLQGPFEEEWRRYGRARQRRWTRNILFISFSFGFAYILAQSLRPQRMTNLLDTVVDELPLVKKMRLDAATKPLLQCYQELNLYRSSASTLTETTLAGPDLLGPQRAFWSAGDQELVLVAWFGWHLNGWPTIVHGGAIATVMSDAMSRAVGCMHPSDDPLTDPESFSVTYLKPTRAFNFYVVRVRPLKTPSEAPPGPSLPPTDSSLDQAAHEIQPHKDLTKQPLPSEPPRSGEDVLEVEATLETRDGRVLVKGRAAFKAFGKWTCT